MTAAETDTSVTRTLEIASKRIGGAELLAEYLGVTMALLQDWIAGRCEPPTGIYVRVLDLLITRRPA